MYRLSEIKTALRGLVGWEQSYNPATKIDDDLTASESGLTFQAAHPLLTLENMRSVMPEDYYYKYPEWDTDTSYLKGAKVRTSALEIWRALAANTGSRPAAGNANWEAFNPLSDYLYKIMDDSICQIVQSFTGIKELNKETRELMDRRTFFDGAARRNAIIDPRGKLVGFEIVPVRSMGVTTQIKRIGLQMTGATGNVTVYLFHSSQIAPVKTVTLNFTNQNGGFQWFDVSDMYLPYIGENTDAGGAWYLVYNQAELPSGMYALNVTKDWSKEPCQTCSSYGLEAWKEITKYMQVSPFCTDVPEGFTEDPEIWDVAHNSYTNTQNYGMNCEITVGCDLTDFIISQRQMFATVLQKQLAVIALRTMAMNPDVRVNRNQANITMNDILYEIDGAPTGKQTGLGFQLRKAYVALSLDTRGLDRLCLACNNHGVKYRGV